MKSAERLEAMCAGLRASRSAAPANSAETRRFNDRLRFDQHSIWTGAEPRSLPPSTWPAVEDSCRRFGIPYAVIPTGWTASA